MENRKNIVVLFGGASSEYEVSLQSAYAVICNMDRKKYNPVPVGITREGQWFYFTGEMDKLQRIRGAMRATACRRCSRLTGLIII